MRACACAEKPLPASPRISCPLRCVLMLIGPTTEAGGSPAHVFVCAQTRRHNAGLIIGRSIAKAALLRACTCARLPSDSQSICIRSVRERSDRVNSSIAERRSAAWRLFCGRRWIKRAVCSLSAANATIERTIVHIMVVLQCIKYYLVYLRP
jgi:hypothetical protein